jgi:hypothetical protein
VVVRSGVAHEWCISITRVLPLNWDAVANSLQSFHHALILIVILKYSVLALFKVGAGSNTDDRFIFKTDVS